MSLSADKDLSLSSTPTKFDFDQFDTRVEESDIKYLAETVESIIQSLNTEVSSPKDEKTDEEWLLELLRSSPGQNKLREIDSARNRDPEPLTEEVVIEPLFGALGYPDDPATEVNAYSENAGPKADYSFPIDKTDEIESSEFLVEAEPLNKDLWNGNHGVHQVTTWLGIRGGNFDADFGIATDGMRWILIKHDPNSRDEDVFPAIDLQPVFVAAFENHVGDQAPVSSWLTDDLKDRLREFLQRFGWANFLSIAADSPHIIREAKEEITDDFYDRYIELVFGVVDEDEGETTSFSLVGDGILPPDEASDEDVRAFAVELMNRLIFIRFLEDADIVRNNLLSELVEEYDPDRHPHRLYNLYLEPLLFGVLDEIPDKRGEPVASVTFFEDVPYLNGGLFRPSEYQDGAFDDQDFTVRDDVLKAIITFLEHHTFSARGGPTDLDPSVLGRVFEKTINYLAGEDGAQKELGAYYTPDDITTYCAERVVNDALLERFKQRLQEDWEWRAATVAQYDDVYDLIDSVERNTDVVDSLLDEVDSFSVIDPACGSGHFLTSVLGEITSIRQALNSRLDGSSNSYHLKKETILDNLYGVDVVESAVQITKLRLWLNSISELTEEDIETLDQSDLALPNVSFNIREGNTLLGYTGVHRLQLDDDVDSHHLNDFGEETIESLISERQERVNEFKKKHGKDAHQLQQKIDEMDDGYNDQLNDFLLDDLEDAGVTETVDVDPEDFDIQPECTHKVKIGLADPLTGDEKEDLEEDFRDAKTMRINRGSGGYVSITLSHKYLIRTTEGRVQQIMDEIGVDRVDQLEVERYLDQDNLTDEQYLHWPLEFYEVFDEQGGFDVVIGNPPYGIDLSEAETQLEEYPDSNHSAIVFATRSEELAREEGHIMFVVPKPLTYAHSWRKARTHLADQNMEYLIDLEKSFDGVDQEQMLLGYKTAEPNDEVTVGHRGESSFIETQYQQESLDSKCFFMWVDEENRDLVAKLQSYDKFGETEYAEATKGIDYFKDYLTEPDDGTLAYRGGDVGQFQFTNRSYVDESITDRSGVHPSEHNQEKVVFQRILAHVKQPVPRVVLMAAVDREGAYVADTAIYAVSDNHSPEFLCGLLNSSLFSWYAYNLIYNRAIRSMDLTPIYFDQFPTPPQDDDELVKEIGQRVEEIQQLEVGDEAILDRYEELNEAVFDLYQLSEAERELVREETPPRRSTLLEP